MFNTPILLLIFNRPETTRQVFEVIRQQRPKYLYVAADGPRPGRENDVLNCAAARAIIKTDWDCELHTHYRDQNLGCGRGPAKAITWFFQNVEQGIIIEDDVIPDNTFFSFCAELLEKYKNDQRIAMISGINLVSPWKEGEASYFFALMGGIPGWATWRRAWENFEYSLQEWKTEESKRIIKELLSNKPAFIHFERYFNDFSTTERVDVWDYQWLFARWNAGACSIVPAINLIENIGFGPDATHTVTPDHPQAGIKAGSIDFPLRHRSFKIDQNYDRIIFDTFIRETPSGIVKITKRLVKKILKIIFC